MIKIIGLGSGEEKHLTLETINILKTEKKIFLRTKIHPSVKFLDENNIKYKSFDYLYEKSKNFDEIYNSIVNNLVKESKSQDLVYAVPGNPVFAEKSVFLLLNKAKELNIQCKIFPSISFLDSIFTKLEFDPLNSLLILDATNLKVKKLKKKYFCFNIASLCKTYCK
ncbi:MAG: hypothetical protein KatS3mg068_0843 [Candidatus Sericytochromatia bacterium]|nr:MAG: hypothetical protein KatS3mg068_0843 [Candidatus Sericytochromatia bacterium]